VRETLSALSKKEWLAILLNRSVYVMEQNRENDSKSNSGTDEDWSLILAYRHPTTIEHARFIGPDRLVVVESESGRLVAHDFGEKSRKTILTSSNDKILGGNAPVETLHRGTCVGYANPRATSATMPDGREIDLNNAPSVTKLNEKHQIRVSGITDVVVQLGDDEGCIEFSGDWKRMLRVNNSGVTIYDFDAVLKSGSLSGNEIGTIALKEASSAFFVGAEGEAITAADGIERVFLWKPAPGEKAWVGTEIYKGDNPIIYAEPDSTGKRLIFLETIGQGGVHGVCIRFQHGKCGSILARITNGSAQPLRTSRKSLCLSTALGQRSFQSSP
jgi:hypothetical protein